MEENIRDIVSNPFLILVEREYADTIWLDHIVVKDLLTHTAYEDFRRCIENALVGGIFTSPAIASQITAMFDEQDGSKLGLKLDSQNITTSLTLLRWLLIGFGSPTTRNVIIDAVSQVLGEASTLIRDGTQETVYVRHNSLYLRQAITKPWIDKLHVCSGVIEYWLGILGEQIIFDQRWGQAKKWMEGEDDGHGHWERIWMESTLERLVVGLWKARTKIEQTMVAVGCTAGYVLQQSDVLCDESGDDNYEDGKILKFWAQDGKAEWVFPAGGQETDKLTAEQIRINQDPFIDAIPALGHTTGESTTKLPYRIIAHLNESKAAYQIPPPRCNIVQDATGHTGLLGSPTRKHKKPRSQASEYITSQVPSGRSAIGYDNKLHSEPRATITGQQSASPVNQDITSTGLDTFSQIKPDLSATAQPQVISGIFATDQADQDAITQAQPYQYTTGQGVAPEIEIKMFNTDRESARQIGSRKAPTGQDTAHRVRPAQSVAAQDDIPKVKTNMLATDNESFRVRSEEPRAWHLEERLPIDKVTALTENSKSSRSWYSARKSPDTPNVIETSMTPAPSNFRSMVSARSNLYESMATAPPMGPLPSLPQSKADENESGTKVGALSAEELSDAIISNYAKELLAKSRQEPGVLYPVDDCDSDLKGEKPLCGCELTALRDGPHKKLLGSHTTDRDSDTPPSSEGGTIKDEVAVEDKKTGHDTINDRSCLRIDMAGVGERLAVLDTAELQAMEERKHQDNRSLAEQALLNLPERDVQLGEELQHSAHVKEELAGKLECDTPLISKIKAVKNFFEEVGKEADKVQNWTEELRAAKATIDRGYDIDYEEETPNEETHANEEMHINEQHASLKAGTEIKSPRAKESLPLDDWGVHSVAGSVSSDYTRGGPSSPIEDKNTQKVYTAEEYEIASPPTPTGN